MLTRLASRRMSSANGTKPIEVLHDMHSKMFKVLSPSGSDMAHLEYEMVHEKSRQAIDLYHTYTSPEFQGQGLAGKLVRSALDWAKQNNYAVIPSCSYVASFIQKNPEWRSLL